MFWEVNDGVKWDVCARVVAFLQATQLLRRRRDRHTRDMIVSTESAFVPQDCVCKRRHTNHHPTAGNTPGSNPTPPHSGQSSLPPPSQLPHRSSGGPQPTRSEQRVRKRMRPRALVAAKHLQLHPYRLAVSRSSFYVAPRMVVRESTRATQPPIQELTLRPCSPLRTGVHAPVSLQLRRHQDVRACTHEEPPTVQA